MATTRVGQYKQGRCLLCTAVYCVPRSLYGLSSTQTRGSDVCQFHGVLPWYLVAAAASACYSVADDAVALRFTR